ncbi:MAG: amidohydrolase family protein, partial [Paramuribaculum sp.]|nr:amidohydrolase family protein [Paramuribaculum sp.]
PAPPALRASERRGRIREGYYADLVIFDTDCEPYEITDSSTIGRCGWTPYAGLQLNGKVEMTILNGETVYRHGVVFGNVKGRALRFGH